MNTAIVLSGQTPALGIVRSLGSMGVPVVLIHYNPQDFAQYSRFVSNAISAPHPEDDEAAFIDVVDRCSARYPGAVVMPAADESLVALSRHKKSLEGKFRVACPDWEVTRSIIDKQFTYAVAAANGVPVPRTLVASSLGEARAFADELGYPCLVKPCQSHLFVSSFGRKMVQVSSRAEMERVCAVVAEAGLDVMIQEIIPGDDCEVVNYNAYVAEGIAPLEFTAVHVRNAPPRFGSPRVVVSRKVPEVIEPGRHLLRALGFTGYACTEFKRDPRDSVYKLMEVNGRHNLSTLLAVRCGINFPWLHYRHLSEGTIPSPGEFREGVYWIDLFRDVGYNALSLFQERYTPADYIRPYLNPRVFAIFDRNDLSPFLKKVGSLLKQGGLKLVHRKGAKLFRSPRRAATKVGRFSREKGYENSEHIV